MVPVCKPDSTVRLCIDYRRINGITIPDPFQIPLIEDLLDSISEAKFLSKLDMMKEHLLDKREVQFSEETTSSDKAYISTQKNS